MVSGHLNTSKHKLNFNLGFEALLIFSHGINKYFFLLVRHVVWHSYGSTFLPVKKKKERKLDFIENSFWPVLCHKLGKIKSQFQNKKSNR